MKKLIALATLLLVALFTVSALPQQPKGWEYKIMVKRCNDEKTLGTNHLLPMAGWNEHRGYLRFQAPEIGLISD